MNSSGPPGVLRNTLINLGGQGIPLVVALVVMPKLIHGLGTDRFGVLSLAWLVIGYFSIFDLGLGRALTQIVADRVASGRREEVPRLFWSAILLMAGMGLVGAVTAFAGSHWLATSALKIPVKLQAESITAFRWLAVSIPVVVITAGLVGMLTAYHRFDVINLVRVPLGLSNYLLPLALVTNYSNSLVPITVTLVVTRLITAVIYFRACMPLEPGLMLQKHFDGAAIRTLFRFGSWMTLSNIISPAMVYMDRFLIGAAVSVTAVAYYTTPYEVVTKMLILPATIAGVMFPLLAAASATDSARVIELLRNGVASTFYALAGPVLVLLCFSQELLKLWLGQEFAVNGAPVLRWLAIGVLVNGIAQILFSVVQGAGRSDQTAKLHLVELVIYLPALWLGVHSGGIVGAAVVWTARVTLDALLLYGVVRRLNPHQIVGPPRSILVAGLALTLALIISWVPELWLRTVVFALLMVWLIHAVATNKLIVGSLQAWRARRTVPSSQ